MVFVHALPSEIGAQAVPLHVPEQHCVPVVHVALAPRQHLLCAVQRPNWESQQSTADAQLSPETAQQEPRLQYRGAQQSEGSEQVSLAPPQTLHWPPGSQIRPAQH